MTHPGNTPALFRPCSSYAVEPDCMPGPCGTVTPSCVTCREQYQENVCPVFRRRFLQALGLDRADDRWRERLLAAITKERHDNG
jgi:hypothetical protein